MTTTPTASQIAHHSSASDIASRGRSELTAIKPGTSANKKLSRLTCTAFALFALSAFPQSPPSSLTVPNTDINQGTVAYQAGSSLTTGTNFQINNTAYGSAQSASVLFQVLNSNGTITLLPGFTAIGGSQPTTFKALIGQLATQPAPINGSGYVGIPNAIGPVTSNSAGGPIIGGDVSFASLDGSAQCPIEFTVGSGGTTSLSLMDTGTQSDGVCTINAGSSINIYSEQVIVDLNITFSYTAPETYAITTDAIDNNGNVYPFLAAGQWVITLPPDPTITTTSLPAGDMAMPYSQVLSETGGTPPYTWTLQSGTLPAGLTLYTIGTLSGTPTTAGTSSIVVKLTDSLNSTATEPYSLIINSTPSITTTSLPSGTAGRPYSQALGEIGGTAPYTWTLQSGALPAGITLQTTGTLSGTPTSAGTSNIAVKLTDALNSAATEPYSLTINSPPSITTKVLPSSTAGDAYSQTLTAQGGTPPYSWSVQQGSLPGGINLSSSGTLSGTASTAAVYQFTVLLSDSLGSSSQQSLALLVLQAAPRLSPVTSLQINLGFVPLDKYSYSIANMDSIQGVPYVTNCSVVTSVRGCYQQILSGLSSQNVTGVRFQFAYCGGAWSTALNGCGTYNGGSPNSNWMSNLYSFFQDLHSNQLYQVTPTAPGWGLIDGSVPYCADGTNSPPCNLPSGGYGTCQQIGFISGSHEPGLNDGVKCVDDIPDPCTDIATPLSAFYWPGAPYGVVIYTGDPNRPWGPWRSGYNQSYNCSMRNPNFVGWNAIYGVWTEIFSSAHANSLQIHEFDLQNEMDLMDTTDNLRYITDNMHCDTGSCYAFNMAQNLLWEYGFNALVATASQLATTPTVSGYDCGSFYGDSARVIYLSEMIAAVSGGLVGYPGGISPTNGLYCCANTGCTATNGGGNILGNNVALSNMVSQGSVYTQPEILDYHPYDRLDAQDAQMTFSDIYSMIASYGPSGWHGYNYSIFNAEVMLGETHSGTVDPTNPNVSCEGFGSATASPAALPGIEINGFNASTLVNTNSVVFRPWWYISGGDSSCYPLHPQVNPPYIPTP